MTLAKTTGEFRALRRMKPPVAEVVEVLRNLARSLTVELRRIILVDNRGREEAGTYKLEPTPHSLDRIQKTPRGARNAT